MAINLKQQFVQPVRQIGTELTRLNNGSRIPDTTTRTTYGLTIHAQIGNRRAVIGAVNQIGQRQARQVEDVFEVNADSLGFPVELIPHVLSTRQITIARYELWREPIEKVFGVPAELVSLADQTTPISLRLQFRDPGGSDLVSILNTETFGSALKVIEFFGCYMTDIGRTLSADNVIVRADASLTWRGVRSLN